MKPIMITEIRNNRNMTVWKNMLTVFMMIVVLLIPMLDLRAQNSPGAQKKLLTPLEFKERLKGPILSFPTPFTESYEIDYKGIEDMIRPALAYGCGIVALTSGNSKYHLISYEEVRELTSFVVKAVDGRALTIASTGIWDREDVMDYVRYAEMLGYSAVQVSRPKDLPNTASTEDVVKFYQDVAKETKLGIILHGFYSVELLTELVKNKSIIAMKEDVDFPYYVSRQILFGDKIAIFGGGNDGRYLQGYPYGSPAYYSTLYTYAPEQGQKFWQAIQKKDMKTAAEIIVKYDVPFIEKFSFALWATAIEYFGGPKRFIRPKPEALTDIEFKNMRETFSKMGLTPHSKYNTTVSKGISLPENLSRGGHIGGVVEGKVIIAGGNTWSKDKITKSWLKDAAILSNDKWIAGPVLPNPVAYSMYASDDSGVYFAGGTDDGKSTLQNAYRLNSLKEGWKPLPKLPIGINSGAGAIVNSKFYVAGGSTGGASTNKMFALDLKNVNSPWREVEPFPGSARMFPSLVASGKYLYLLGGMLDGLALNDAYRYDPESNKWTKLADLPFKGYAWAGQRIDDDHIVITGRADNSKPINVHKDVWVLSLKDMSMIKTGELIAPATTAPLIRVSDKQLWLVSGEPDSRKNRTERVSIIAVE
jgi:dihydrodipicolinate synthase/N-acetylneuraminate lyase